MSIIRGDRVYKDFALTVFSSIQLLNLNFKSLISIQRGSVFISRLSLACYIKTIDWNYILKENKNTGLITATNNDCHFEKCQVNCSTTNNLNSNNEKRCWTEHDCQIICPIECPNNCNVNTGKCCKNSSCMHCYNDTNCVGCSNLRNLLTGECVNQCPSETLVYENHSCISFFDCMTNSTYLTRNYFNYNNKSCVRECPNDYRKEIVDFYYQNRLYKYKKCVKCEGNICKKDCLLRFEIKTLSDLDGIKNCVRVRELIIELNMKISIQFLVDSFKYLDEIENYLIISNNRYLVTLNFLKNLRKIHGKVLFDNKYAFFLHKNDILRDLWDYKNVNLTILNGTLKIFENPEFCYNDIFDFVSYINRTVDDFEILSQFNGYKCFTYSNKMLELNIASASDTLTISWKVVFSDLRRLNGYTIFYIDAGNRTFDQNDIDSSMFECNSEWQTEYIPLFGRKFSIIEPILTHTIAGTLQESCLVPIYDFSNCITFGDDNDAIKTDKKTKDLRDPIPIPKEGNP